MRTASSALGVAAAGLLLGACFDPTRQCSTNANCVNGGTCDPGTKTCVAAGNPNDHTPPVLSITVTPPPARPDSTKLTGYDPGSPGGGHDAFRRDENVHVVVTSADRDVDAGSFSFVARGVSQSSDGRLVVVLGACAAASPGASSPFCQEGTIPLAQLPFDAFRAPVSLEASAADLSNNVGSADAGINVTRWKWRYTAGAPIYTTPAIADDGTVVFGTSDGGSGSVYALSPTGSERWSLPGLGPTEASVAIGANFGSGPLVYVASSPASASRINAVRLADGSDAGVCLGTSGMGFSKPILGGLALLSTPGDNGPLESVTALAGGARLITFRPAAQGTSDPFCIEAGALFLQTQNETIVSDGSALYLGSADNVLRSYVFDSTTAINWVRNPAWGVSGGVLIGDSDLSAVAVDGPDLLLTVHPFGLVRVARASGSLQGVGPDGGVLSDFSGPALRGTSAFFGAGPENTSVLIGVDRQSSQVRSSQTNGLVRGVPVLGDDQSIYVATSLGTLEARKADLTTLWSAKSLTQGGFPASPALDCAREGAFQGTLYVASDTGELIAVVVDSRALASSAPWPKYQHDVRNTGNPTTPIQSCP